MSILIAILVIFAVAALCVWGLREISPDATVTRVGTVIIVIVAALLALQRAALI